jgi:hypothetical protein
MARPLRSGCRWKKTRSVRLSSSVVPLRTAERTMPPSRSCCVEAEVVVVFFMRIWIFKTEGRHFVPQSPALIVSWYNGIRSSEFQNFWIDVRPGFIPKPNDSFFRWAQTVLPPEEGVGCGTGLLAWRKILAEQRTLFPASREALCVSCLNPLLNPPSRARRNLHRSHQFHQCRFRGRSDAIALRNREASFCSIKLGRR